MASRFKGQWRCVRTRRKGWAFEIRNGHGETIAVVYTTEADARLMAMAPKFCRYVKKQAERGDAEAAALVKESHS